MKAKEVEYREGDRVLFLADGTTGTVRYSEPYPVRGEEISTTMTLNGRSVWVRWSDGETGWTEVSKVTLLERARHPTPEEVVRRAQALADEYKNGKSLRQIAQENGITFQRVHQLITRHTQTTMRPRNRNQANDG